MYEDIGNLTEFLFNEEPIRHNLIKARLRREGYMYAIHRTKDFMHEANELSDETYELDVAMALLYVLTQMCMPIQMTTYERTKEKFK